MLISMLGLPGSELMMSGIMKHHAVQDVIAHFFVVLNYSNEEQCQITIYIHTVTWKILDLKVLLIAWV